VSTRGAVSYGLEESLEGSRQRLTLLLVFVAFSPLLARGYRNQPNLVFKGCSAPNTIEISSWIISWLHPIQKKEHEKAQSNRGYDDGLLTEDFV
jgi:hypothetical protein